MNTVNLLGRLVRDPELRYTQSGTANCKFTLAVNKNLTKDKRDEFESQGKPTADFIPVVVWGKTAENCANYLAKGRQVVVEGSIQTGSYEKEGVKIYTTDILANRVHFIDKGNDSVKPNSLEFDGFEAVEENDSIPF